MIKIRNSKYELDKPNEGWTLYTDGYIYYNTVLEANATTDPAAFSHIVIPVEITNNTEAEKVIVTAEAVQAQGADASWSNVNNPEFMTVDKIAAWFEKAYSESIAEATGEN